MSKVQFKNPNISKPNKKIHNNYLSPSQSDLRKNTTLEENQVKSHKPTMKEQINSIISEYLSHYCYNKTLESFKLEISKSTRPNYNDKASILHSFDMGMRDQFFNKLNRKLSHEIKQKNDKYKRLEFYLQIYFLIFNKKGPHLDKSNIAYFKNYLETRGEELSKTTQFLPYYALPYIPKPSQHPAISHIFKKQWSIDIKNQLSKFLSQINQQGEATTLEQIYKFKKENFDIFLNSNKKIDENEELKQRYYTLEETLQEYSNRYNELQKKYKEMAQSAKNNLLDSQSKWFSFSRELVNINNKFISIVQNNNLMTPPLLKLREKVQKYQIFLNTNIEQLIQSNNGISIFQQQSLSTLEQNPQASITIRNQNNLKGIFLNLDFRRIKNYIMLEKNNQIPICLLLQALRWRITKTNDAFLRRQIIMSYTLNDILGLKSENSQILQILLDQESQLKKQYTLRLINAIASDYHGRTSLVQTDSLLKKLITIVKMQQYDGIVRKCALNTLQKVSLRSKAQIYMIQNGIIKWIIQIIKLEKQQLSQTSFNYLTALLMNLTLKKIGRIKCQKQQILQLLIDLLKLQWPQFRTFVSGSIFSLISRQKIREEAEKIKMKQQLSKYLQNKQDTQFNKQITYILQKFQQDCQQDQYQEQQQNDIDDLIRGQQGSADADDIQQEEIQEYSDQQILVGTEEEDKGEELLIKKFSCVGPQGVRQQCLTRSILDDVVKKNLEISIIKQKKTPRSDNLFKPNTPAKSSLQILQAIDDKNYDSSNYLPIKGFRKKSKKQIQYDQNIFEPKPLIPRTPPEPSK